MRAGKIVHKTLLALACLALLMLVMPSLMMQAHVCLEEHNEDVLVGHNDSGKESACEQRHHHDHSKCPVCELFTCLGNETANEPSPDAWEAFTPTIPVPQGMSPLVFDQRIESEILPRAPPFES